MAEIATQRLKFRAINYPDVKILIDLFKHEAVRKHLGGPLEEEVAKQKAEQLVGKHGYFLLTIKENDQVIGLCYLDKYKTGELEVSYELFPQFWGQGFGKEAVAAIIQWGFENMNVDHIIAVTQKTNEKSRKLLDSIGMVVKDEFEEYNEPQVMYSISR